jgi:hypothetical protein
MNNQRRKRLSKINAIDDPTREEEDQDYNPLIDFILNVAFLFVFILFAGSLFLLAWIIEG